MAKRKTSKLKSVEPRFDEEEAFRGAICADPESDTPRLVFSDWLEENGQSERAEFIRLQCELARLEEEGGKSFQVAKLKLRCNALLGPNVESWSEELRSINFPKTYSSFVFRRGFIEKVSCEPEWFVLHGEKLFEFVPLFRVQFVHFANRHLKTLKQTPHLARVRELQFLPRDIGEKGVASLVDSALVTQLRKLDLSSPVYDPLQRQSPLMHQAVRAIAVSPNLPNLESLNFQNCNIGDEGALALLQSTTLLQLRELRVAHNPLEEATLDRLRERFGAGLKTNYVSG